MRRILGIVSDNQDKAGRQPSPQHMAMKAVTDDFIKFLNNPKSDQNDIKARLSERLSQASPAWKKAYSAKKDSEVLTSWRDEFLHKVQKQLVEKPWLLRSAFEVLLQAQDYNTAGIVADRIAQQLLPTGDINADIKNLTNRNSHFNENTLALLLTISDFFEARAASAVKGTQTDEQRFSVEEGGFKIALFAHKMQPLLPETELALVRAILRLPYRKIDQETNTQMLKWCYETTQAMLKSRGHKLYVDSAGARVPPTKPNSLRTGLDSDIWQSYLKAGINYSINLAEAGQTILPFEALAADAEHAAGLFPQNHEIQNSRLRILQKWHRYVLRHNKGWATRLRNRFYHAVALVRQAIGPTARIDVRCAKLERDAGYNKMAYGHLDSALQLNPNDAHALSLRKKWEQEDENNGLIPPKRSADPRQPSGRILLDLT